MADSCSSHPRVSEWLSHIRTLSVNIGPRGSTLSGERHAAEYARDVLARIGLTPRWEEFRSARSVFQPHLVASLLYLAGFAVFPIWGRLSAGIAAVISIVAVVSQLQALGLRANLLQLLVPTAGSQNVFAVIPPTDDHQRDLVLVGHLDTQRTPLVFSSPRWVKAHAFFTVIAMIAFIWQAAIYALAFALPLPWVWPTSIPSAACEALIAALCIEADSTPFTAGANDNATGAGLVLTLAARIAAEPFPHTRVFAVLTGCEEVGQHGMSDFYRRHRAELREPRAVVFEMLGGGDPGWLIREGAFVPFWSDPVLRHEAQSLSDAHPEWRAWGGSVMGGNTELASSVRAGVPAITLGSMKRNGEVPYWHQRQDTFDKLDPLCLERAWEMSWALIRKIGAK